VTFLCFREGQVNIHLPESSKDERQTHIGPYQAVAGQVKASPSFREGQVKVRLLKQILLKPFNCLFVVQVIFNELPVGIAGQETFWNQRCVFQRPCPLADHVQVVGVWPALGCGYQPGRNRINMNVACQVHQIFFLVHPDGAIPPLKEWPLTVLLSVDSLRVGTEEALHKKVQVVVLIWFQQEVIMVRQQGVSDDGNRVAAQVLPEQSQKVDVVIRPEEDIVAIDATVVYVVIVVGKKGCSSGWHRDSPLRFLTFDLPESYIGALQARQDAFPVGFQPVQWTWEAFGKVSY
jgi:hypothetical protein